MGDGDSVKPVEIPPPRPKRKPMHPYPRKLASPVKRGVSIPERSVSPQQSPTSVLSGVGSDQSGGADSCMPNGSVSPVSSSAPARSTADIFGSEAPKLLSEDVISMSQSDHEDENSSTDEEIPLVLTSLIHLAAHLININHLLLTADSVYACSIYRNWTFRPERLNL